MGQGRHEDELHVEWVVGADAPKNQPSVSRTDARDEARRSRRVFPG